MAPTSYTKVQRRLLLDTAVASIHHGVELGTPLQVDLKRCDVELKLWRASFVTIEKEDSLRGCIGTLTAMQPLLKDVAQHAYAAAFQDPRFPPVDAEEIERLSVSISILTEPTTIEFNNESDLLRQLRPEVDGLILESLGRRATFLPAVWEQIADASEFLNHLKVKMGLAPNDWPADISAQRYETISIS